MAPDMTAVRRADLLQGEDEKDTALLMDMKREAEEFLLSFPWCDGIVESYFGRGIGGVVAAFLLHIKSSRQDVDEWLWAIVGDLPPAYIVTDGNDNAVEALESYVREMKRWVAAVYRGRSVDDLIPVNVSPTKDSARRLEIRLQLLESEVLPQWRSRRGR